MLGLDPMTLPAAYMLAAAAACPAPVPPIVHMTFIDTAPIQRSDVSGRDLGTRHISTTFSHTNRETWLVSGLTQSDFDPTYLIDFNVAQDPASGTGCVAVKTVEITVKYAPTIYVASELKPGSCRFGVVLQHEARHVNTDIITFNEQLPQLRQAVEDAANQIGWIGPITPAQLIPERDKMVDRLKAALVAKADEVEQIRFTRQQMIDTRQEYLRVSKLCPEEPLVVTPP